ncbi:GIN domain-containing protein [Pseudomonas sp. CGJS7]|uniref:GIN domain-containing protein n=1 Tax=Pseudomonas sp. CGJS7 TaxID=3109348 RepID=UPI00300A86D4
MRLSLALLSAALLLPLAAQAQDRCDNAQPRNLQLDLAGVKAVVFQIGSDDLDIKGAAGARGEVKGRACASNPADLAGLTLSQRRVGDKLFVTAEHRDKIGFNFNGQRHMQLHATVPENLLVQLEVGSGDASVENVAALSADVNSGDIKIGRVRGLVTASVGSGDIDMDQVGALQLIKLGSGDLKARGIARDAKIGSVGSGDVELRGVGGSVELERLGSGDLDVSDVRGNLRVARVGSGSVHHRGVAGRVDVPQDD